MESVNKLEIIYELVMICIFEQVLGMLLLFINGTMIGVSLFVHLRNLPCFSMPVYLRIIM